MTQPSDAATDTSCVEHGKWTPVPVAPPADLARFTLRLADIDPAEDARITQAGVMTFHAVGCSGDFGDHQPQQAVADAMAVQVESAGVAGRPGSPAVPASFFFQLGDVAYMDENKSNPLRSEQSEMYNDQFYAPYTRYGRSIFALAGNHDGKTHAPGEHSGDPTHAAVAHFLQNFCAQHRDVSPDNRTDERPCMTQPYVYWRLSAPLAEVIGLYANIANAGMLDDPAQRDQPQYRWLVAQLSDFRRSADNGRKALLLAVHYPAYSGVYNFRERGDPTLAETPGAENATPLGTVLQRAFAESGRRPDAILSAHTHLYQRLTYRYADGWELPCLVAGSGGHAPVASIREQCGGGHGPARSLPFDCVLPRGEQLGPGDRVQVVACNDQSFGFLRLTIAGRVLTGEFFTAAPSAAPVLYDSFSLDMDAHRIGA